MPRDTIAQGQGWKISSPNVGARVAATQQIVRVQRNTMRGLVANLFGRDRI
jgi:hypothetical protein